MIGGTSNTLHLDAARALARGEPLTVLQLVGRDDLPLALTMRGIAYAQMGDYELSRTALEQALARADDPQTRACARAAHIELLLSTGAPAMAARMAMACAAELTQLGDHRNAAMQQLVAARAEVLRGRLDDAARVVDRVMTSTGDPHVRAIAWLARAEMAIRRASARQARLALMRASRELIGTPHAVLSHALAVLQGELARPLARVLRGGRSHSADLFAIEDLSRGSLVLVDACRRSISRRDLTVSLGRRPVLFALVLELARAFPAAVARDDLAARAFGVGRVNASHRVRLRVEVGRLRRLIAPLAVAPTATREGYALRTSHDVAVLLPASDAPDARVLLLLGDGAAWAAQSLAEHSGISRRSAQRALAALVASGGVVASGHGSARRYTRAGTPVASRLLLLGLLPHG